MQPPESLPRPPTYRLEFAEEARKWALARAPDEALARHFEIPLETPHEWLASVPEFARARAQAIRDRLSMGDAVDVLGLFGRMLDQMAAPRPRKRPRPLEYRGPDAWMG